MVDFRRPDPYQLPHRKPLPLVPDIPKRTDLQPLSKIVPDIGLPPARQPPPTSTFSSYTRNGPKPPPSSSPSSQQYPNTIAKSRRTPSQSTTSTSHSNSGYPPSRTPSNVSSVLSRNASTRSGASTTPGSYVALMRKQKATVWCDRAQHEDPRIAAQHKAAKIRAAREITGQVEGRTSTSGSMGSGSLGVRSKIRHHGLPKATGYSGANMVGGGVPMRLSANEVGDDGNQYEDADSARRISGRSSGDNRWLSVDQQQRGNRYSQGSTPNGSGQGSSPNDDIPEMAETEETPVPGEQQQQGADYFAHDSSKGGSGGSSERENSFGNVGQMQAPKAEKESKTIDDLRRRGSVDERANTMGYMGGGRLFVANPDLSD
ncbi:MAG: hypothetical protein Q9161_004815 [Pseudevernia consocians]